MACTRGHWAGSEMPQRPSPAPPEASTPPWQNHSGEQQAWALGHQPYFRWQPGP